jgi:predicted flap endonuclease-1-like 5' DNA nuclease
MALLIDRFSIPLAVAAILGLFVGWTTCSRAESSWKSSWLPLAILAFILGVFVATQMTLRGRAGMWLETALLMFAAYIAGCCISCLLRGLMRGPYQIVKHHPQATDHTITVAEGASHAGLPGASVPLTPSNTALSAAAAAAGVAATGPVTKGAAATGAVTTGSVSTGPTVTVAGANGSAIAAATTTVQSAEKAAVPGAGAAMSASTGVDATVVKPPLLSAPRGGKKDELCLIWGVADKLEERMNRMGIWHFDQIAAWTPENAKWFELELEGFKGRIERDKWIEQCKKLAEGWRPSGDIGERPKG